MPELPDVLAYIDGLERRIVDKPLRQVRLFSPFVLRSVQPPLPTVHRRVVRGLRRLGKRIVIDFGDELYLVIHLMIAGRLRWEKPGVRGGGKIGLAALDFDDGTLLLTEASPKKRASLHLVQGETGLLLHDRGGLDVLNATAEEFCAVLRSESHTLKRALSDPTLFSGIGNAYSDEILHAARLSPVQLTRNLTDAEITRLYASTQSVLRHWIAALRAQFADHFPGPGEITAFRPEFAVHGKYRQPCPDCGAPIQRIRYAENETNYCPHCQTEDRLLADRALSRLLKNDWPRSLDEMELQQTRARAKLGKT